jgi:hypothetical protein
LKVEQATGPAPEDPPLLLPDDDEEDREEPMADMLLPVAWLEPVRALLPDPRVLDELPGIPLLLLLPPPTLVPGVHDKEAAATRDAAPTHKDLIIDMCLPVGNAKVRLQRRVTPVKNTRCFSAEPRNFPRCR